jgi:hypothetical protein
MAAKRGLVALLAPALAILMGGPAALATTGPLLVSSPEDLALAFSNAQPGSSLSVRLAAGARYTLAGVGGLSAAGLAALSVSGPAGLALEQLPVLDCAGIATALSAQAITLTLANVRVEGCSGPAVVLQQLDAALLASGSPLWALTNCHFSHNTAQVSI